MKLPNGFGTVYKMQGNRRRPYVAKKTIQGKQKAIGYFETFEDAMACLVAYNRDPDLLSPSRTTFSEVYALWKAKHFPQLRSESARISYRNSYRHCARLHSMVFVDIRLAHLDMVIDDVRRSGCGQPTQKKVRSLLEQLYKYAARYDLVTRDYARYLDIDRPREKRKKKPFTVRQRNKLWRGVGEMPFPLRSQIIQYDIRQFAFCHAFSAPSFPVRVGAHSLCRARLFLLFFFLLLLRLRLRLISHTLDVLTSAVTSERFPATDTTFRDLKIVHI